MCTRRMMRQALDIPEHTSKRVAAVVALVDCLGLQPSPPLDPLPEIDEQDLNLVISHDCTLVAVGPPHEVTRGNPPFSAGSSTL